MAHVVLPRMWSQHIRRPRLFTSRLSSDKCLAANLAAAYSQLAKIGLKGGPWKAPNAGYTLQKEGSPFGSTCIISHLRYPERPQPFVEATHLDTQVQVSVFLNCTQPNIQEHTEIKKPGTHHTHTRHAFCWTCLETGNPNRAWVCTQ